MHLIIATDEAGYGPKLGPLIIAATAWRVPSVSDIEKAFENLSRPVSDDRCGSVFIDDSKKVFKRNPSLAEGQQTMLEVVCRAASHWAALPDPVSAYAKWLSEVAAEDFDQIATIPWYAAHLIRKTKQTDAPFRACNQKIIDHWSALGVKLCGIQARVITASSFNNMVNLGSNKADILTEGTCGLVWQLISKHAGASTEVSVFSDRHGGRAYYGAALQHQFPDSSMRVLQEASKVSKYLLQGSPNCGDIEWSFTVSGDSFPPVAFSSMIAKWLREHAMGQFNEYFQRKLPLGETLIATAGYPSDANRYLADLQRLGLRQGIDDDLLIRKR